MPNQKWFLTSKRVWAVILVILGAGLPLLGINAEEAIPVLSNLFESGLATAGATLALVHVLQSRKEKKTSAKLTLKPPTG
jgi:hypothetical protein